MSAEKKHNQMFKIGAKVKLLSDTVYTSPFGFHKYTLPAGVVGEVVKAGSKTIKANGDYYAIPRIGQNKWESVE